jgi:tetratricopeptide (TPR) repeat protein
LWTAAVALLLFTAGCKSKKSAAAEMPKQPSKSAAMFGYFYVTGCHERAKGNLKESMEAFQECLKIEPENAAAHYEVATVSKLLGNAESALRHARICAVADARNEWYQLLYIDCLTDHRQFSQALKLREVLVKNFPEKNEFREDLAINYAMLGMYDKSFRIYEELEKLVGINEQLTLNKVKLLKSQNKLKETEGELKRLSDTDTTQSHYYALLAEFYMEQNDMVNAKKMYDRILLIDPSNADVRLALHDYYSKNGDDQLAFEQLKLAIQSPDLESSIKASIIGSYYMQAENRSEPARKQGLELATLFVKTQPEATEANALYGDFLRLEKKNTEAAIYYYKAAMHEKKDYRIWDNLLYVDNELNRFDSLEKHSYLAMELFPNQPVNYIYNGVANTQLRNYQKAVTSLKTGIDFVVDNRALLIQFYSALGDAYYYLRDYVKSDQAFDKALKEDADNTYVLNNYAYYLSLRNEQLEKAERLSRKSNELQPNNRNYMDTYGWILFQEKKYSEADEWLSRAAQMGSKSATILEHYGDNLFMLGKKEEAVRQWEAAKSAGGNSPALLKKIKEKKINGD